MRAVIGPNGAGKTTFFNVLAGLASRERRTIFFKGRDITRMPGPQRVAQRDRQSVSDRKHLSRGDRLENVRLAALARVQGAFAPEFLRRSGRLERVDEIAHDALEQLELRTSPAVRAGSLSHGDKKRLDIAVALATEPEILLLDEPVAGMSIEEVRKTEALMRALAKEMTVLLIEHDMDLIMGISDSITVLASGPRARRTGRRPRFAPTRSCRKPISAATPSEALRSMTSAAIGAAARASDCSSSSRSTVLRR